MACNIILLDIQQHHAFKNLQREFCFDPIFGIYEFNAATSYEILFIFDFRNLRILPKNIWSCPIFRLLCLHSFTAHTFVFANFPSPKLVGTDEATTCVGISIRNCRTGMISLAHMDFPNVVENGLSQMLSLITDRDSDTLLDVHLVGGFDDISSQHPNLAPKNRKKLEGYSYPLCAKIIETLRIRSENFQIRTLHVLGQNTKLNTEGFACPIFHGFVVDTSNGSITPASFDRKSRCPDEIVRRIRVTASFEDPNLSHKLLDTYETNSDNFVIAPCVWTIRQKRIATTLQRLSDIEILLTCSSSPSAEAPDFVDNERRKWDYLIRNPNWRETFPSEQPRRFQRTPDGNWVSSL
ncbi:PREDICTED: uncharacterized protein LOC105969577 isoform X1 [Erythranthe guttata]|uniref:uncharacterized protein LOC105969577 isoform X1 n=1 Tax=Erythranthe guttata TaxID=4155 RepID=UPI00064E0DE4|nr:PREDICTED: uncharacterized protein LOC105969577 isoform X1 [Erythranthe guttata]|eukprot:XP_012849804.1 PREDICTED: uncharacterized protein LOC105969577 isoform X1 [Erythranthe guttata]